MFKISKEITQQLKIKLCIERNKMKNSYKLGLAAVTASLALVGCGGGNSSSTTETFTEVTGQFVDGYVSGLNYSCDPSGKAGITNDMGEYTCNEGDKVTFSLGAYVLGTATASSGIVTPYDIQSDNETSAINVARLLQTLDTDDSDDIITIPADFTALDNSTVELNATFSDFEAGMIEDLTSIGITDLIGSEEAQNTMDGDILTALLAGKTFYNVGSDNTGDNWIDSIVFNADATSLEWSSLTDTESETLTVEIDGNSIILSGIDGTFELVFVEETADKLVFHGLDSSGVTVEEDFMFFDQAAAQAYYDSLQPEPVDPVTPVTAATFVSGKSFDIGDGMILTFGSDYSFSDNDGCSGTWSELTTNSIGVSGSCEFDVTFNGELVDGVAVTINVTDVSPTETFNTTFTEVTSTTTPTPTADLLRSKLSSATYYGAGDGNIIEEMVFNPDVTFVSVTEVVGGSANYSSTLSFDGLVLTYVDAGNKQITFTEITDTYLVYTFDAGAGTSRWFTSQAAAQAYFGIN